MLLEFHKKRATERFRRSPAKMVYRYLMTGSKTNRAS